MMIELGTATETTDQFLGRPPPPDAAVSPSPYRTFSRDEWARLRADTPLTLTAEDVLRLQSLNDPVSLDEVVEIYLPLSRLLSLYVAATQGLFKATQRFLLAENEGKAPYIIGLAGSVAVGKSSTARLLKSLLARWPNTPKVDLVTTDGFLLPNAELRRLGLMERKGFPESYDTGALLRFLAEIKAGGRNVKAPVYSHLVYDVIPGEEIVIESPDILIVEGLNVLQPARLPKDGTAIPFVSDYFDFSIYIDADEEDLRRWYVNRFLTLRHTAFRDPKSFFHRYAELSEEDAVATAEGLWHRINLPNLRENILPTRQRAGLILRKDPSHRIEEVALRRL
jgi:type I pantothenate kinase